MSFAQHIHEAYFAALQYSGVFNDFTDYHSRLQVAACGMCFIPCFSDLTFKTVTWSPLP
jgi:hypothetical protein